MTTSFKGFESPRYTIFPNDFFDVLMSEIDSQSELKVTLAVMRYTLGFHRHSARLSISYLERATGLSRPSVIDGLRRAIARKTIKRVARNHRVTLNILSGIAEHVASKDSLPAASKESLPPTGKDSLPKKVKIQKLKNWKGSPAGKRERKPYFQGKYSDKAKEL